MMEVAIVAPFAHEPGLIAYECHACGHVKSVIQMALRAHSGRLTRKPVRAAMRPCIASLRQVDANAKTEPVGR